MKIFYIKKPSFAVVLAFLGTGVLFAISWRYGLLGLGWWPCLLVYMVFLRSCSPEDSPPVPRRTRFRDQGVWANPPAAVLDKSTVGRLLAGRSRRDPRLRVVIARPGPESAPPPEAGSDALWDRELDG